MTKRRFVLVCALFVLAAMLLAGCGAAATPAPATATPVPPAAATPVPPTPVPPTPVPPTPVPPTPVPPTPVPPTPVPPTPTTVPTVAPTAAPTVAPTAVPTKAPVATLAPTAAPTSAVPRPSNPGGPGKAIDLTGDPKNGLSVFLSKAQDKSCATCHGTDGKGGVPNPGSTDGTVPPLNPIDPLMTSKDYKTFATNIDLFIEHGSTPDGPSPQLTMPAWGDQQLLSPQQIADVIAYVISLNP